MTHPRSPDDICFADRAAPETPSPALPAAVGVLATATAEALEQVAAAAVTGDVVAARRVLRSARRRRAARSEAERAVRRRLSRPSSRPSSRPGALRRTGGELQLVAELGRVGHLVDGLARQLVSGRLSPDARSAIADDLRTLEGAGGRRLRHLADLSGPAMHADYLRTGAALRHALDQVTGQSSAPGGSDEVASAARSCSCLIESVLAASSLATRVA